MAKAEEKNNTTKKNNLDIGYFSNDSFEENIKLLAEKYGNSFSLSEFVKAMGNAAAQFNVSPFIQNRKIKELQSLPSKYTEEEIVTMAMRPDENETSLRKVEKYLEGTTPLGDIRKTYQDIPLFYHYAYPTGADNREYDKEAFEIDEKLVDKIIARANFASVGKEICGQALQEGKVFRWLRENISTNYIENTNNNKQKSKIKTHIVNMFNLTPLPSDWIKIVGLNDMSKYTVALNMFYFMQPGVNAEDYMELIYPYFDDFKSVLVKRDSGGYGINAEKFNKIVYQIQRKCNDKNNQERFKDIKKKIAEGGYVPEVYRKNGIQYYWVTLPIDKVYTFEIDPTNPWVSPTFSNTFLSMTRISKGEQIQMEVLQNPLVAFMTGSIPYEDSKKAVKSSPKLSPGMTEYWLRRFLYGLAENNVNGVGASFLPVEDIKFHQMADSPNASEMATKMYQYTMLKSNMGGLVPITDKPLAEQVKSSQKIKARYCHEIYNCFIRMMNNYFLYSDKLKYNWRFDMFGDVFSIEDEKLQIKEDLSNGITSALYKKYAIEGKTLLNARSMMTAINGSGILDMLRPLKTSYTQTDSENGRPTNKEANKKDLESTQKSRDYN